MQYTIRIVALFAAVAIIAVAGAQCTQQENHNNAELIKVCMSTGGEPGLSYGHFICTRKDVQKSS